MYTTHVPAQNAPPNTQGDNSNFDIYGCSPFTTDRQNNGAAALTPRQIKQNPLKPLQLLDANLELFNAKNKENEVIEMTIINIFRYKNKGWQANG